MVVINLPVTHLIRTVLRPGVQSIQIQYKYQSSTVWTNYNEGQRIPGGVEVKFTVTPYPNFTLTEWKAYYSDEYDDTVNISLTGVQGESAWTFILPSADVWIRCEAEYSGSSTQFSNIGGFTRCEPDREVTVLTFLTAAQFLNSINSTLIDMGYNAVNSNMENIIINNYPQNNLANLYINSSSNILEIWYFIFDNYNMTFEEMSYSHVNKLYWKSTTSVHGFDWNSTTDFIQQVEPAGNSIQIAGYYFENRTAIDFGCSFPSVATYAVTSPIVDEKYSIRYILNPTDSGEIDANAPTEIEVGITQFTFKWRVKHGYTFKRLTPFAVGDGSLEDDVLYSSVYDGETRTYTVTVQQIPNWAIGVRVLIECTNNNDPNVGGDSQPGGGDGTFDETSDPVPIEPMPSISAADAGLITLFRPSLSELKGLGAYLWTNIEDFIVNLQKMFSNPMDTIIALNILPGLPPVGTSRNIRLGLWETTITMPPVLSQWYEIDFGSVNINEFWGSALDYSPNTKIHAMLPFIGSVQLNTDDVMGTTVGLVYRIDLLSGHLVAMITVNDDVLYQFTGECAVAVPLTGADWSRVYGAIAGTIGAVAIGAAGAAATGAATAGLSQTAAAAQHVAAQADFDYMTAAISGASQSQLRALDSSARQLNAAAMNAVGRRNAAEAAKVAGAVALGGNAVNQIMGAKFQIAHSGTISGSAGLLGVRRPYIYIEYPNQSLPENYKHFYGYPSNMHANLGSLRGFTQCYQVLLTGVNGTDGEIAEILELLKEGVYL